MKNHSAISTPVFVRCWIFLLVLFWFLSLYPMHMNVREAGAQLRGVIKITSPASSSLINAFQILVRGTLVVVPGSEVGVTINGFPGFVDAGQFAAIVPVDARVTSLAATARDSTGNAIGNDSIPVRVVTPTTEPTLFFRPSPFIGATPVDVSFTLTSLVPIMRVTLDADGNGSADFMGTSLEGRTFVYSLPGLYFPKVTVEDTAKNTYTETTIVRALMQSTLDVLLQGKWTRMKDELRKGNVTGALQYIATKKRASFEKMFKALTVPLSSIDQVLGSITYVGQLGATVEYEMLRTKGGTQYSHMIRFILDEDGIWRVGFL